MSEKDDTYRLSTAKKFVIQNMLDAATNILASVMKENGFTEDSVNTAAELGMTLVDSTLEFFQRRKVEGIPALQASLGITMAAASLWESATEDDMRVQMHRINFKDPRTPTEEEE